MWTTKANVDDAITAGWMAKGGNMPSPKNLKSKLLMDPATDAIATTAPYTSNTDFYVEKVYYSNSSSDQSLYIYVTGVAKIYFYAWCNSTPDNRTMDITVNGVASGTISFATGTANAQYTSVILTKSANNIIRINGSNEVELTAIKVETVEKSSSSLVFASTSGTGDIADGTSFTLPSLTKNPVDATVTYSSSNEAAATVNSSTGAVTLVAPGVTTITASFAGNASYYPSSATYELTVVNTAANTITVSYDVTGVAGLEGTAPESFNIDEGENFTIPVNQSLYVEGKTLTGWEYNSTTYAIGANMTAASTDMTLTPVFTANGASSYLGHNTSTATWQFGESNGAPSWDELQGAGQEVTYVTRTSTGGSNIDVKLLMDPTSGKIHNKGRNDKWCQMNEGTKLTVPALAGAEVVLYVYEQGTSAATFGGTAGTWDSTAKTYSYTATADGDLEVVMGAASNGYASKLVVTYPTETEVLTVSANDTKIGLTKANISAVDYLSVTTDNWTSEKTYGDYTGYFYNMSNTDRELSIKVTGASNFEAFVRNDNSSSDRSFKLKVGTAEDVTVAAPRSTLVATGVYALDPSATTTITLKGTGSSVYPVYFHFNPTVPVTITEAGWATLYTDKALDFSGTGLTAYTATCSGSIVALTPVTNIPANTGVVLKGAAKDYKIPVIDSSETAQGDLKGSTTAATAYDAFDGYTLYVLTSVNEGANVQFNPVNSGSIAAGKAYLKINGGQSYARSMEVVFADDILTGINEAKSEVKAPKEGKFFENGKLVIFKKGMKFNANGARIY